MTTAKNAKKKPDSGTQLPWLALDGIGDLSGLLNQPEVGAANGRPLALPLDLIDEDPNQPRTKDNPGLSAESLGELADTIRLRGVKTPISVRDNPEVEGRFIINHGVRRTRSSRLAGKTTIPGFIDNDYHQADQVIENLQRNDLTPREIADYIGRELAKGKKKGDIAKELGKSAAFVSQHVTLLDLPDPIAEAFNSGRSRDVTVINELVTVHKKKPDEVATWLADENQEITRGSVALLREFLEDKRRNEEGERDPNAVDALSGTSDAETGGEEQGQKDGNTKKETLTPDRLKKPIIQVKHDRRLGRLMLSRRPTEGCAWLKYEDDGLEIEAPLSQVRLVALLEG